MVDSESHVFLGFAGKILKALLPDGLRGHCQALVLLFLHPCLIQPMFLLICVFAGNEWAAERAVPGCIWRLVVEDR